MLASAPGPAVRLRAEALPAGGFVFRWRGDASRGGSEHATPVPRPLAVELGEHVLAVPDLAAAHRLAREHRLVLSDEELPWTPEQAQALLEALRALPAVETLPSRWTLTGERLPDDLAVEHAEGSARVRVARHAFTYASARPGRVEGQSGRTSSRRLHHAVVRWLTRGGRDRAAVGSILGERYGLSVEIPDYAELTAATTRETAARFQEFAPEELLLILEQLEELPPALRVTPGLVHLVRRLDGTRHPTYPQAPAVSWPQAREGYIELMEAAFAGPSLEHSRRLILHEKAHFLWATVLGEEDRRAWERLGGWYADPDSASGWATTGSTDFVSSYAHLANPDEDLAESFAWFVVDPDKLRSRAPEKYAFVRDEVMGGVLYLSELREDLTFTVLNERPDYVHPGPVERVEVQVEGAPESDKRATIEIELGGEPGELDGAQRAVLRLVNDAGVQRDVWLVPVEGEPGGARGGAVLRGDLELSRFAVGGFWFPLQMIVTDAAGNERFERGGDYGWKMFVDNPLGEDEPPRYVPGSLALSLESERRGGRTVQVAVARWKVEENAAMADGPGVCSSALALDGAPGTGSLTTYGTYDPETGTCTTRTAFGEHRVGGRWRLTYLTMRDAAGNVGREYFTGSGGDEAPRSVVVASVSPDTRPPELALDELGVSAVSIRPDAPDGETRVTIIYLARDDASGLGQVSYVVRDPQGVEQHHYHYHENFHGEEFRGDPTEWRRYEAELLLPAGSAPGTWGVTSMQLGDKAGNSKRYGFTETLRFEVIEP